MLKVENLSLYYDKHMALDGVSIDVKEGETVAILGANGAGKSSLLKAISGMERFSACDHLSFDNCELASVAPYRRVDLGLALVPEGRGLFPDLSVEENILLGANPKHARKEELKNREYIFDLFPKLALRARQLVGTMSGGEQQMVAIARAIMAKPKLLMLDEPSLGLAPIVVGELFEALKQVRASGVAMLIVEQNVQASLAISDRGYLMETGSIVGQGTAQDLLENTDLQSAYLGTSSNSTKQEQKMKTVDLLINGELVGASNNASFQRQNPITEEPATKAAAATVEDALRAADAAAAAFPEWSETPPKIRREILFSAANSLKERSDKIVEAMATEIGATKAWAMFNISLAADMLVEAASMTTQISGELIPSNRPGSLAMAVRQPVGVVLSIAPWNAPVILGVRSLAMPLACGNTVVMKTSEICPNTHLQILEALQEGGLPKGVLNGISNAPENASEIVEALIAHRAVRRINFTGSTRVGRVIAETAGRHLKPALLELGGKAPAIVLDDADLDHTVACIAFGAYMNQGQICMSTEKVIVDEKISDEFVAKLTEKVRTLKAGDPSEGKTPLGSVVDKAAAQRIERLIEDAVEKGAVLLAGGIVDGTLIGATLLDRVSPSMKIYHEETFGPVACIYRAGSIDEAVRVANDTEYGLSASVFGADSIRAMNVAKRIESGICHINGPTVHDEAQMPFGGVKESGYGRFGGKAGIDQFTELRWITIQDGPLQFPI